MCFAATDGSFKRLSAESHNICTPINVARDTDERQTQHLTVYTIVGIITIVAFGGRIGVYGADSCSHNSPVRVIDKTNGPCLGRSG